MTTTLPVTTGLAAPRVRLRPLTEEAVFIRRSVIHSLRTPDQLMMAIALPTILMLMFTWVFGGAIEAAAGESGHEAVELVHQDRRLDHDQGRQRQQQVEQGQLEHQAAQAWSQYGHREGRRGGGTKHTRRAAGDPDRRRGVAADAPERAQSRA